MTQCDGKKETQRILDKLIAAVCSVLESENRVDVYFYLLLLSYAPANREQAVSDLCLKRTKPMRLNFGSFTESMDITHLSKSDCRNFTNQMAFIACFQTYDGARDLLIVRVPMHGLRCQGDHYTEEAYEGGDVCFVIDTTGSMSEYIDKVKLTITSINENEALLKKIKSKGHFSIGHS